MSVEKILIVGAALSVLHFPLKLKARWITMSGNEPQFITRKDRVMPDMLEEIFRLQGELNKRIGVDTLNLPAAKRPEWVLNYCRAMSQEVAELTDSVPWKWWAKYQKFDKQNARVEVVDLFHFLISLAQVLGMSAQDVYTAYCRKNEVNFQRQDSGYTVKHENDSQHI